MQAPHHDKIKKSYRSSLTSPLTSSNEDLDNCLEYDLDDIEKIAEHLPRKPHFLDYDYVPPPPTTTTTQAGGFIENNMTTNATAATLLTQQSSSGGGGGSINYNNCNNGGAVQQQQQSLRFSGEHLKMDKKYETDGEVSDFELATKSFYNEKRENICKTTTTSASANNGGGVVGDNVINCSSFYYDNIPRRMSMETIEKCNTTGTTKKKSIFHDDKITRSLDYDREQHHHHHQRSLDRNFERLRDVKYEQNLSSSLEQQRNSEFKRCGGSGGKDTNFSIPKFLDRDVSPIYNHRVQWPTDRPSNENLLLLSGGQSGGGVHTVENIDLGPKVECVYSLLSMLGSHNSVEMSTKFVELSKIPETCSALRRSGCIPLLVQMMHTDLDVSVRKHAGIALHNVIYCHPDDKVGRREAKVLRLVEQIMEYNDFLKKLLLNFSGGGGGGECVADDMDRHPSQIIYSLMKVSFDEDHRHTMCLLGALPAIANLVYLDHAVHGNKSQELKCITLRRYSGMALTNLTFGDGNNKALLCANKSFMKSLVAQLDSSPEELIQVTACVLRNLSWRADNNMKAILTEIGTVTALTKAAMKNTNENTLKSILSALWNLTAHCSMNKAELCNVDGALGFLADMLMFEAPPAGKNLAIVENAGGILRNVSSHIAVREDYRKILRERNCLGILLQQLKSESLTVVSNACGTLWNLSARCPEDQKYLCDNSAVPMLRSLVHSKHKMISNGSNAALKNLLNFKPPTNGLNANTLDPIAKSMGLKELPSLNMRKKRALEQELARNLSETCENIDIITPPKEEQNVQDFCNLDQGTSSGSCFQSSSSTNTNDYGIKLNTKIDNNRQQQQDIKIRSNNNNNNNVVIGGGGIGRASLIEPHPLKDNEDNKQTLICNQIKTTESNIEKRQHVELLDDKKIAEKNTLTSSKKTTSANEQNRREFRKSGDDDYDNNDDDQLTDFSVKYNRESSAVAPKQQQQQQKQSQNENKHHNNHEEEEKICNDDEIDNNSENSSGFNVYQETDLDQITDYSLRYAENHLDSDEKITEVQQQQQQQQQHRSTNSTNFNNELVLEDTVKCYETEGTPYTISSATSLNDLRLNKETEIKSTTITTTATNTSTPSTTTTTTTTKTSDPIKIKTIINKTTTNEKVNIFSSGINTPEKPIKYCEEGTPEYFSRRDSINSVDDISGTVSTTSKVENKMTCKTTEKSESILEVGQIKIPIKQQESGDVNLTQPTTPGSLPKVVTFVDFAQETPLMFSRHSSLESLSSAEPECMDDRSSIVSEFSRLASGIISPSELPDSPTQNMPEINQQQQQQQNQRSSVNKYTISSQNQQQQQPLQSIFEDNINEFIVENTPAQFSSATSLSNLSLEDEPNIRIDCKKQTTKLTTTNENVNLHQQHQMQQCNNDDDDKICETPLLSDGDESSNDGILLATCINIGMNCPKKSLNIHQNDDPIGMLRSGSMNRPPSSSSYNNTTNITTDELNKFNVEDSPCNFSMLSSALSGITCGSDVADLVKLEKPTTQKLRGPPLNHHQYISGDESLSSLSIDSEDDNNLLNQAIEAGFNSKPKYESSSSSKLLSQSNVITTLTKQQQQNESSNKKPSTSSSSSTTNQTNQQLLLQDGNDSLSSIGSCESIENNQQTSLFEQCIKSGMHKDNNIVTSSPKKSTSQSQSSSQLPTSFKSTPSSKGERDRERDRQKDREKKDEQLLLECITTGMSKSSSRSRSSDTTPQIKSINHHRHHHQLSSNNKQQDQDHDDNQDLLLLNNEHHFSKSNINDSFPKNGEATSAIVHRRQLPMRTSNGINNNTTTIVDVEVMDLQNDLNGLKKELNHHNHNNIISMRQNGYDDDDVDEYYNDTKWSTNQQQLLETSIGSLNISSINENILECSNEYPAFSNAESLNETDLDMMELSNEFLMDHGNNFVISATSIAEKSPTTIKFDKHKDPDLMLKSVERLTYELVSTAEYLRTTTSTNCGGLDESTTSRTELDHKSTSSNNTWNNDLSNELSFPSISRTAPLIRSLNDDDDDDETTFSSDKIKTPPDDCCWMQNLKTPTNETKNILTEFDRNEIEKNSSLTRSKKIDNIIVNDEDDDDGGNVNVKNEINFHVGGKVQNTATLSNESSIPYFLSSGSMSFDTTTTMTNSTIIAMEANRLMDELKLNMHQMTDSVTSLDLDNIRPPSVMDNLSLSTDINTPQLHSKSTKQKKSLGPGIVARRALAQHGHTTNGGNSLDLSLNLENIKPPSIMDELLDSMISVASITSEMADNFGSNNNIDNISHYDTALSDIDDTMTLQSCLDIPNDSTLNLTSDDFSSAESTPKKNHSLIRKSMTPKQKRQLIKDRYRTYTIAADMILSQKADDETTSATFKSLDSGEYDGMNVFDDDNGCGDQMNYDVWCTNVNNQDNSKLRKTAKQKRQDDPLRFQTQILDTKISLGGGGDDDEEDLNNRTSYRRYHSEDPTRYLTQTIVLHDNNLMSETPPNIKVTDQILTITTEKPIFDDTSFEYEQNSETESFIQTRDNIGDFGTYTKSKPKINNSARLTTQNNNNNKMELNKTTIVDENKTSNNVIVVRGRKKAAYVSPYRQSSNVKKTTPSNISSSSSSLLIKGKKQLSSPKPTSTSTTLSREPSKTHASSAILIPRKQTQITNTHVVINKANLTSKINSLKSSNMTKTKLQLQSNNNNNRKNLEKTFIKTTTTTSSVAAAIVSTVTNLEKSPKLLLTNTTTKPVNNVKKNSTSSEIIIIERQSTFVKDDEPMKRPDVPVVLSEPSSPAKSRIPSKIVLKKSVTEKTFVKTPPTNLKSTPPPPTTVTNTNKMHTNKIIETTQKRFGISKSPSVPNCIPQQRSKSNTSMKTPSTLTTPPPQQLSQTPKTASAKVNITSKIAGLWKQQQRGECLVKKQDNVKSNGTVVQGSRGGGAGGSSSKLVRSFTFDAPK